MLAEGAYLGPRVVCKLYDWTASRYDSIKSFDPFYEQRFVGEPLAIALAGRGQPLVLDVAGGTGRLPRALFPVAPSFSGVVVELDRARAMLTQGRRALAGREMRVAYVQADALWLPFPDSTFDAVVSLEALEFLPDLRVALAEMARVLRPGGLLMITNRKGWARYYMPGRVRPLPEVLGVLRELGLPQAESSVWQVNYDLVCAVKGSQREPEARAVRLSRRG
ncbi:MAG: class I SAM-dependent methyltransferase [Anaerolineae bacterium]|nr:class I SAM-dependent methyltransferase [Anaerolineae bacterium]